MVERQVDGRKRKSTADLKAQQRQAELERLAEKEIWLHCRDCDFWWTIKIADWEKHTHCSSCGSAKIYGDKRLPNNPECWQADL